MRSRNPAGTYRIFTRAGWGRVSCFSTVAIHIATRSREKFRSGTHGRPLDPSRPNDPKDQQAFVYPLYVVFLLAPTVGLPFAIVHAIFFWLLLLITAASVLLWLEAIGWRIHSVAKFVWMLLTLSCFPSVQGLKLQQLSLLVAALLAGTMCCLARRHFVWAGTGHSRLQASSRSWLRCRLYGSASGF